MPKKEEYTALYTDEEDGDRVWLVFNEDIGGASNAEYVPKTFPTIKEATEFVNDEMEFDIGEECMIVKVIKKFKATTILQEVK